MSAPTDPLLRPKQYAAAAGALRSAANLLDTEGWTRGALHTAAGSRCALGAILDADIHVPDSGHENAFGVDINPHVLAFAEYLLHRQCLPPGYIGNIRRTPGTIVMWWNDSKADDGGEVRKVLSNAATWAEERGA